MATNPTITWTVDSTDNNLKLTLTSNNNNNNNNNNKIIVDLSNVNVIVQINALFQYIYDTLNTSDPSDTSDTSDTSAPQYVERLIDETISVLETIRTNNTNTNTNTNTNNTNTNKLITNKLITKTKTKKLIKSSTLANYPIDGLDGPDGPDGLDGPEAIEYKISLIMFILSNNDLYNKIATHVKETDNNNSKVLLEDNNETNLFELDHRKPHAAATDTVVTASTASTASTDTASTASTADTPTPTPTVVTPTPFVNLVDNIIETLTEIKN